MNNYANNLTTKQMEKFLKKHSLPKPHVGINDNLKWPYVHEQTPTVPNNSPYFLVFIYVIPSLWDWVGLVTCLAKYRQSLVGCHFHDYVTRFVTPVYSTFSL